jgi:predicted porin
MKLTKTAVALAVASIAAAPMMASATTTLSGLVQVKIQGNDDDGDAGDPNIAAGDVLFGITSEHTMNNGLTGYGSMRADFNSLSNEGAAQADSVYVGVKGGFGDIRFGEIPLAIEYGQKANDIYDLGPEINGGLSYTGTFGPASILLNYSPALNQDTIGAGAKFDLGGFSFGVGAEDRDEKANVAAGVSFGFAGASIAAHFGSLEQDVGDDVEVVAVKAGYGIGNLSLSATFQQRAQGDIEEDTVRFDIVYDLGGDTEISSRINSTSGDRFDEDAGAVVDADGSDWRIQLTKFF